jgi:hypothetical protein
LFARTLAAQSQMSALARLSLTTVAVLDTVEGTARWCGPVWPRQLPTRSKQPPVGCPANSRTSMLHWIKSRLSLR